MISGSSSSSHTLDLKTHIQFVAPLGDKKGEEYWDDNVHFSPKGYDMIGECIAQRLIRLIRQEDEKDQADDTAVASVKTSGWEEEMGDPRNISEGYVVVEKRDLD